jgi:hypothetical protein
MVKENGKSPSGSRECIGTMNPEDAGNLQTESLRYGRVKLCATRKEFMGGG